MNGKNIHIVTGLHRAGTHAHAEYLAKIHNLFFVEESHIKLDGLRLIKRLKHGYISDVDDCGKLKNPEYKKELSKGFVVQCPFLAHKVIDLAKLGKVYWCKRNSLDTVTSMKNGSFDRFSWKVMNAFHDEFPEDDIWPTLTTYDGSKDVFNGFINHYAILLRMKEHFLQTKFKDLVEVVQLEEQPYYDRNKSLTSKKPLRSAEMEELIL